MRNTAEWVSPNHPDKVCDAISDAIVDACLAQDPLSRVAVETQAGHGTIMLAGEVTTDAQVDFTQIARDTLTILKIPTDTLTILQNIHAQSPDIARGVDTGGAGDQGIMVGYACRANPELLPPEYFFAKGLGQYIYKMSGSHRDIKTQVTTDSNDQPVVILVSAEKFTDENENEELRNLIYEYFITVGVQIPYAQIIINPCGPWIGGFNTDAGVTGRKIVVDQYGPQVPVGGGAFSGKDPTKVDRSAAYMARKVAKEELMSHPEASEVLVKVSYAIGMTYPLSLTVQIDGQEAPQKQSLIDRFVPGNIIRELGLRRPIYLNTILHGNYGNQENPWEIIS